MNLGGVIVKLVQPQIIKKLRRDGGYLCLPLDFLN